MGGEDRNHQPIDDRRSFVQRLETHEDVRRVDFTRDGFRTVFVDLEPDGDFRHRWRRTASELGYTVEGPGVEESWPGWLAEAWILRLSGTGESAARSRSVTTLHEVVSRLVGIVRRRLPERSDG